MKRWSPIPILVAALGLVACRQGAETSPSTTAAAESPVEAAPPRNDRSIYALRLTLTDQDGASVGLDAFRGKPVFISMFYGRCPSACPLLVSTIKTALSRLDPVTAAEVRVLLVSFDPEHDTPAVLSALARERGLDAHWKLASAPEDQVRDLAAVLGIQYRRLPDGNFSHTSPIVLLDRSGAIDTRLEDTSSPLDPLVARARAVAAAR
jgi:protein SCO1/2